MKQKKECLVSAILFAIGTVIWIISISINYHNKGGIDTLIILQSCCAVCFSAAAIANFVRYRQNNRNNDDK